jgi:DNA-directed RNA polymerase subunit N (RpoN/RPB10)
MTERCYGCGKGIDVENDEHYRRVTGWLAGPVDLTLPTATINVPATVDEWCCSNCHRAMVLAHHNWHQPSLFPEAPPQPALEGL